MKLRDGVLKDYSGDILQKYMIYVGTLKEIA